MNKKLLKELNDKQVREVDKYFRMFGGLSSRITDFKKHIVYLTIHISEEWKENEFVTAEFIANAWKNRRSELSTAKQYHVTIIKIAGATGISISINQLQNQNKVADLINQFKIGIQETETIKKGGIVVADYFEEQNFKKFY